MTTEKMLYWIWLSLHCGAGNAKAPELLDHFKTPMAVYEAKREDLAPLCEKSPILLESLLDKDMKMPKKILAYCQKAGVGILTCESEWYPERLRTIPAKPLILYCRGKLRNLNENLLVACVGTRNSTDYGDEMAYKFGAELAMGGAVVVSGMALGIDSKAHEGALSQGGYTVAVLGCGIDIVYPKQNKPLMREILKNGLVVTEYPPGTKPTKYSFPIRNRIISGLCQATLVVEAPITSGALITAARAIRQGRTLYAVPGDVGALSTEGTNDLIREGAKLATCAVEILKDFELAFPNQIHVDQIRPIEVSARPHGSRPVYVPPPPDDTPLKKRGQTAEEAEKEERKAKDGSEAKAAKAKKKTATKEAVKEKEEADRLPRPLPDTLGETERKIALALTSPMTPDALSQVLVDAGSPIDTSALLAALTTLEIEGIISLGVGGQYKRED